MPSLKDQRDEALLNQLLRRWDNHNLMVRWLSRFFNYLDRCALKPSKLLCEQRGPLPPCSAALSPSLPGSLPGRAEVSLRGTVAQHRAGDKQGARLSASLRTCSKYKSVA